MGDNSIGIMMGRHADIALSLYQPKTAAEALVVLDNICKPYSNRDAEFESVDPESTNQNHPSYIDYRDPGGPLGQLIAVAFGVPGRDWVGEFSSGPEDMDDNPAYVEWWKGPCEAFNQRYNFY